MNQRMRVAVAMIVLLGLVVAVTLWISRREPAPPSSANVPAARPAAGPAAPAPAPNVPAPVPSTSSNVTLAIEAARSSHEVSGRAAAPSTRSAKEARKLAIREEAAAAPVSEAAPEAPATEPAASAEPTPPEPAAKAPPRVPEPKPEKVPDGTALGRFQNRVGPSFSLARVTCQIDGQTVYAGPGGASVELFRRSLPPGNHSVSVVAEYRANSAGLFSYAEGFRFKVTSGKRFNVESAKPAQLSITAFEKGGPTREFADRLALAVSTR